MQTSLKPEKVVPHIESWIRTSQKRKISRSRAGHTKRKGPRIGASILTCCLAVSLVLFGASCQTYNSETLPTSASGETPGVLAAGDTIKVAFTTAPEFNQSQKIEPDGRVSLPLIGEVYAVGKSTGQFQSELTQLYKSQLQNSDVVVTLESVSIPVVVSGEVQKPGKIVFERPATVLEAIMEAGGFTAYGDPKRISVIRRIEGVQHMQMVDVSQVLRGIPSRVMYVSAGDVIYVRPRFVSF
jgi:polysaccharide export outer membrane protein